MDFNELAISPEVEEIFGTNRDFGLLLRPDNHVGLISSTTSSANVREYLSEFISHAKTQRRREDA